MSVVFLSSPASNDKIGREGHEQGQEIEQAVRKAKMNGVTGSEVRAGLPIVRKERWCDSDKEEKQARCDKQVRVAQ